MYEQFNAAGPAPAQPQEQGLDIEGQIRSGVEAFAQSQDPAIAVEVVNMLAQMMGIAPEIDPYAGQAQPAAQQQAQPGAQGVPMARNGMRMYRRGGKVKKYASGGETDPKKKSETPKEKKPGEKPAEKTPKPAKAPSYSSTAPEENNIVTKYRDILTKDNSLVDVVDITREEYDNAGELPNDHPYIKATNEQRKFIGQKFQDNPNLKSITSGMLQYGRISKGVADQIPVGYDPNRASAYVAGNEVYYDAPELNLDPPDVPPAESGDLQPEVESQQGSGESMTPPDLGKTTSPRSIGEPYTNESWKPGGNPNTPEKKGKKSIYRSSK